MISSLEFNDLEKTIEALLSNAKKRYSIHEEIFGDDKVVEVTEGYFDKLSKYNTNESIKLLQKEVVFLVNNIDKKTLHNLFLIYLIGSSGPDFNDPCKEYKNRLKEAKQLAEDEYYRNNKFLDIEYKYLKNYLYNGMNYCRKNFIEK